VRLDLDRPVRDQRINETTVDVEEAREPLTETSAGVGAAVVTPPPASSAYQRSGHPGSGPGSEQVQRAVVRRESLRRPAPSSHLHLCLTL